MSEKRTVYRVAIISKGKVIGTNSPFFELRLAQEEAALYSRPTRIEKREAGSDQWVTVEGEA